MHPINYAIREILFIERAKIYNKSIFIRWFYRRRLREIDQWLDDFEWEEDRPRRERLQVFMRKAEQDLDRDRAFLQLMIDKYDHTKN